MSEALLEQSIDAQKAIRAYLHEQPMQVAQLITAMQALEALDELESSARGDEPFNHAAAPLIRAFIEGFMFSTSTTTDTVFPPPSGERPILQGIGSCT